MTLFPIPVSAAWQKFCCIHGPARHPPYLSKHQKNHLKQSLNDQWHYSPNQYQPPDKGFAALGPPDSSPPNPWVKHRRNHINQVEITNNTIPYTKLGGAERLPGQMQQNFVWRVTLCFWKSVFGHFHLVAGGSSDIKSKGRRSGMSAGLSNLSSGWYMWM